MYKTKEKLIFRKGKENEYMYIYRERGGEREMEI